MKKALLPALTAVLILAFLSLAFAEDAKEPGFFEVLDKDGRELRGHAYAVPVGDGVIIVPAGLLPEDMNGLVISDGVSLWEAKAVIPDETGTIATVFYDTQAYPARYSFWQFMPWGADVSLVSCCVRVADSDGITADCGVFASEEILLDGRRFYLASLTGTAPAGSPLLTGSGELAGIVVAEWAEGINRVLILPTEEIVEELSRAAMLLSNLPGWGEAPEGLKISLKKNRITVDWNEMTLPEKTEGEKQYIVLVDAGNTYLNFYPAETSPRTLYAVLTPGRFYMVGVVTTAETPDRMPESYALISVPPAKKLTEFGFRPVTTAIAEEPPEGLKEGERPMPVAEVTEELLRSGRAYFYSHSVYEVTRTIDGKTLLVTLTDPYGVNYTYESSWLFMPEYNDEDIWYISLKDTGLMEGLDTNGYPQGIYRMAYYVDGDLADSFEFELK